MWLSQSEGMHSLLQIELNSEMRQLMVSAPSNFNNFADMPSAPGAFPSRSCEIASSISSSVMGWDRSSSSAKLSLYNGVAATMSGSTSMST